MPNTETYWSLNGVSLHEYAWSIETIGGDLSSVPGSRGDDLTIPGRPGSVRQKKMPESRVLSLAMFTIGATANGAPGSDVRIQHDRNYAALKRLFYSTTRTPGTLTKRFYDDTGVLRTASAQVELVGGLSPRMDGRARSTFVVDLLLADPFFYGTQKQKTLASGNNTLEYFGDAPSRKIKVVATGARGAFTIWNRALGMNVRVVNDIPSGQTQTLDVEAFTLENQQGFGCAGCHPTAK